MKKLFAALMTALLTAGALTMSAAAASDEILIGTPVLDGELDEIYAQSLCVHLEESNCGWQYQGFSDVVLDTYILYDADYLYVFYKGTDDDMFDADDAFLNGDWAWTNDTLELTFGDGSTIANVLLNWTSAIDMPGSASINNRDYIEAYGSNDGENFQIEVAIPRDGIAIEMKDSGEIRHYTQINDRIAEDGSGTHAMSLTGQNDAGLQTYKLSTKEVIYPEPETEAEVVETVTETVVAAPQTFDVVTTAAVAAVVSLAGFAISKKR